MPSLHFVAGTLELRDIAGSQTGLPSACAWDPRSGCFRAPASAYAPLVLALKDAGVELDDQARKYTELDFGVRALREPRPFQTEALDALKRAKGRAVVVLPTGAGKSHLAIMAIDKLRRSTLVVAPTLDLVRQWYDLLRTSFGVDVGIVGGGEYSLHPLTVTTYDSAYLHMENFGNRFGFVVFDECHHLPAEAYSLAAQQCLAPYRLGLTATLERADGREAAITNLIGPVAYRKEIVELSGEYLSDYDTECVTLKLSPSEREEYESERAIYTGFLRSQGIRMSTPQGWMEFVQRSARGTAGRRAMQAYRRQRALALAAPAKLDYLELLLRVHRTDLSLIFTQDNATAYEISRRFLVPAITHQTKISERSEILGRFSKGEYGAVVTSKVLNEGVDVPEANVAVIISGSASVREHVQRLGRILRRREGKRARLYGAASFPPTPAKPPPATGAATTPRTVDEPHAPMLTADLVRATCRSGNLRVTALTGKQRTRAEELATAYLAIATAQLGAPQHELKEAFAAVDVASREAKLSAGLIKLIEDACDFEAESAMEPRKLRSLVFTLAAEARKGLSPDQTFDRRAILEAAGQSCDLSPEQVEQAIYSDLKSEHRLLKVPDIEPSALLRRYDLAQLQAVLLRAVKITATVTCATPAAYRDIFRKLKFRRLLFQVRPEADGGYRIDIDGPFSLFDSVTKYGLQLALMLPALLAADRLSLQADLRWGKQKTPAAFTLEHKTKATTDDESPRLPDEVAALLEAFSSPREGWTAKPAETVLDLPGVGLCIPDIRFAHKSGATIFLEVLGYWSRDAVWKRVEMVQKGVGQKLLFAASERLRVSEQVLADHPSGALYVYKSTLSAKAVLEHLEKLR